MEEFNPNLTNKDYYDKYVKAMEKILKRKEIQKKANKKYFNTTKQDETTFCEICNSTFKKCSFFSHTKTKKHMVALELQNKIKELQK